MVKTNEHLAQVIIGSIHHQIMLDVTYTTHLISMDHIISVVI